MASTARPNEGLQGRTVPTEAGLFHRTRLREGNQDFFEFVLSLCLKADSSYKSAFLPSLFHTHTYTYIPSLVPMLLCLIGVRHSVVNVTMVKAE